MSNTTHGGPFIAKRGVPLRRPQATVAPEPITRAGAQAMGTLAFALAATVFCGGLWATLEILAQEESRLAAERVHEAEAALQEPMTPGLATRLVRSADPVVYGRCYQAAEASGWPTAETTAGAAAARRMTIADCLRREGTVPR